MKPNPLSHTRWALVLALLAVLGLAGVGAAQAASAETAGIYSGTFSGIEKGTWLMWLDEEGKGRFMAWSDDSQLADAGTAAMNPDGSFSFSTTYGMQGAGSVSPGGKGSGTFSADGQPGSLEGLKQDSAALQKLAGSHAGTYTGSDQGTWRFEVSPEGLISGSITASGDQLAESGEGLVDAKGQFIFLTGKDTSLHGSLDAAGKASGAWSNPFWETRGTLSDAKQLPAAQADQPGAAHSGESRGCFVDMLTDCFWR
jgi:hypothetical protein